MRKYVITLFILFPFTFAVPQIPNPSFENWEDVYLEKYAPVGWKISGNNLIKNVLNTNESYSGSYAVKGEIWMVRTIPIIPALYTGFYYSQRPVLFTGFHQYHSVNKAFFEILVILYKDTSQVAVGHYLNNNEVSTYSPFNVILKYQNDDIPDSCTIKFSIHFSDEPPVYQGGSYFLVDDVEFSFDITKIPKDEITPQRFLLEQNYPNPFNPVTTIHYQTPVKGFVSIKVYDLLGREVMTLVNEEKPAGEYSVEFSTVSRGSSLTSGVYFYKLEAGGYVDTKKLLLLK